MLGRMTCIPASSKYGYILFGICGGSEDGAGVRTRYANRQALYPTDGCIMSFVRPSIMYGMEARRTWTKAQLKALRRTRWKVARVPERD